MPSLSKFLGRSKTQRVAPVPELSQNERNQLSPRFNHGHDEGWSTTPTINGSSVRTTYYSTENPESELWNPRSQAIREEPRLGRHGSSGHNSDHRSIGEDWVGIGVPRGSGPPRPTTMAPPPPYVQGCGHIHKWSTYNKADVNRIESQQNCSIDSVRRLRELIRERYALDLELWGKRNTHRGNYRIIMPKCEKADEVLQEIYWIVNSWDENSFTDEEWDMVQKIRVCLQTVDSGNQPAYWQSLPPWERLDERGR